MDSLDEKVKQAASEAIEKMSDETGEYLEKYKKLQEDYNTLKASGSSFNAEYLEAKKKISVLLGENSSLHSQNEKLQDQVDTCKKQIELLEDGVQGEKALLVGLENKKHAEIVNLEMEINTLSKTLSNTYVS